MTFWIVWMLVCFALCELWQWRYNRGYRDASLNALRNDGGQYDRGHGDAREHRDACLDTLRNDRKFVCAGFGGCPLCREFSHDDLKEFMETLYRKCEQGPNQVLSVAYFLWMAAKESKERFEECRGIWSGGVLTPAEFAKAEEVFGMNEWDRRRLVRKIGNSHFKEEWEAYRARKAATQLAHPSN